MCVISFMSDTITFMKLLNQLLLLSFQLLFHLSHKKTFFFFLLFFTFPSCLPRTNSTISPQQTVINLPDDFLSLLFISTLWNLKLSSLSLSSLHAQHKKCVHYGMKEKLLVFVFSKLRFVYLQYKSWWKINHNLYQQEKRTKNWKRKRAKSFFVLFIHESRLRICIIKERTRGNQKNERLLYMKTNGHEIKQKKKQKDSWLVPNLSSTSNVFGM